MTAAEPRAKPQILVTGATGFVGQALLPYLKDKGYFLRTVGRDQVGDFHADTDWSQHLEGVDTIIHLAGRAHVMNEGSDDPLAVYRTVNRDATLGLARQALDHKVRRFVYISSIKVMGESSGHPLSSKDPIAPCDPYGQSKAEAEQLLSELAGEMEIVILRPPLIYGPGVKGNFIALLKLLMKGLPLPLGAISNKRSLIYLGNFVSAIEHAIGCETGCYLPTDRADLSTPDLFKKLAAALDKSCILLPIPTFILTLLGKVTGKSSVIQRLTGSLTLDGKMPGWVPPYSVDQGLTQTAQWYKDRQTRRS